MRVLIDALTAPGDPRGVGRYVRGLAGCLPATGDVEVLVAHGRWHAAFFEPLAAAGVELVPIDLPSRGRLGRHAWQATRLRALARRSRADILHVTDRVPASTSAHPPMVVTIHDVAEVDRPDAFGTAQRRYRRFILHRQLRDADALIAPSAFSASRVAQIRPGISGRTSVVPSGPGIDPATAGRAPGVPIRGPFFLCVGAVQRHKNLPRVVGAFRRLDGGARLVIAGADHNDHEAVDRAIAGDQRVLRLPQPTDAEIAWLYGHAVALIFPSLYEGFGLPVLEAMAFGCPVVTSDRGALSELAGDAAELVDPFDEDAIHGAMRRLRDDPALAAGLATAGRERASHYSWARAGAGTAAVYRSVLGMPPRDAPSFPA